ncbi:MAG: TRAP transporter permease [Deltaproteobacteria bacterium]|nr:TRAP transporter permease [Deltaproteobacteria bacterium]
MSETHGSDSTNVLTKVLKVIIGGIAVGISLFHLYTGAFGTFEAYSQRFIHLMTLMTLTFLTYPASRRWAHGKNELAGILPAAMSATIGIYLFLNQPRIVSREWYYGPMTVWDFIFGILLIILLLDAARRVVGWALPIIATFFCFYGLLGIHFPYPFTIRSPPFQVFIDHMFLTPQAIFGVPTGVSATFVFLFILFGTFLEQTKGGQFIIDISMSLVGRATGGPAKVAVVASSLFGTISGHSVANVYGTGTFTIPLMKRMGYKPEFAGAVEAAASAGGQIMPPIMGAAAFIMAEILGIDYLKVCLAALLPAILYYVAVFSSTHIEALKMNLRGLSADEVPAPLPILKRGFHFIIPIVVLVTVLFKGYTPFRAAFLAIIVLIVVAQARSHSRLNLRGFYEAMLKGGRNGSVIAISCACAGIVVGVLDVTGLGIRFVTIVTELSGGIYPIALVLVMISCLILGMGVPTAPAYIIAAMIAGPTLIHFGADPIAAHMFVFYSALLSAITPPVALAAYAGAAIAGGRVMRTGLIASKLGFVKFLVPYIFIYNTALLMIGTPSVIIWSFLTAVLGTVVISMALEGYLFTLVPNWLRPFYFIAGSFCLIPEIYTDFVGLGLSFVLIWLNYRKLQEEKRIQPA